MSDLGKVLDNLSSTSFFSSPETARKMKKDFTENDRTLSPSNGLGKPTANTATIQDLDTLKSSLSIDATVDLIGEAGYATSAARWSDLNTPKPGAVVNVASESDIEATIQWATKHGVPFVAQSGGHAWASWFKINSGGIVINMRKLNNVDIDTEKGLAVIGGGAVVQEVVDAAKSQKSHIVIGTCNSVGAIASITGGGIGHLMGLYGPGADNMVSARLIGPDGIAKAVSAAENSDLWWALRGAAHNFGIISSLTVKVYPEINDGLHFIALVAFPDALLEQVTEIANKLELEQTMSFDVIFGRAPPTMDPMIAVSIWHAGSEESAKRLFAPIFDLQPFVIMSGMVPYDHLNDGIDPHCFKGGYKTCWSVSVDSIDTKAAREIWDEYVAFSSHDDAKHSIVNFENYSHAKAHAVSQDENAVGPAIRTMKRHCFASTIYSDAALIQPAKAYGEKFRNLMTKSSDKHVVYPNFSVGDEDMEQLYGKGERLEKLRALKRKYDPEGLFSHFIPIN